MGSEKKRLKTIHFSQDGRWFRFFLFIYERFVVQQLRRLHFKIVQIVIYVLKERFTHGIMQSSVF